jgi:hypothetical protein
MSALRKRIAQVVADILWGEDGHEPDKADFANADRILEALADQLPQGTIAIVRLPHVEWSEYPHLDTEEKREAYQYALIAARSGGIVSPIPPRSIL